MLIHWNKDLYCHTLLARQCKYLYFRSLDAHNASLIKAGKTQVSLVLDYKLEQIRTIAIC